MTLAGRLILLVKAAGQNVWMEQDKPLSASGKTAPSLHAADGGLAVSSSKGKDKMVLIKEEICSSTHAFNPLWQDWLP